MGRPNKSRRTKATRIFPEDLEKIENIRKDMKDKTNADTIKNILKKFEEIEKEVIDFFNG